MWFSTAMLVYQRVDGKHPMILDGLKHHPKLVVQDFAGPSTVGMPWQWERGDRLWIEGPDNCGPCRDVTDCMGTRNSRLLEQHMISSLQASSEWFKSLKPKASWSCCFFPTPIKSWYHPSTIWPALPSRVPTESFKAASRSLGRMQEGALQLCECRFINPMNTRVISWG